ncbi:MAG: tryptophanase [candidate division KSB1 bacterium]|nr:tryptophanase [candidate division KSB1 bacterium]MDZ7336711.1 tryptophanase [candidate division KSB1 bacterium]MDZ7402212.1 tryptophanase [candidate division KSB1 bacterium]
MKTIIEPFRIKMVEPIKMTTRAQREEILRQAGFNLFLIDAENVIIDLLTDSGTAAMSHDQWAGMMRGDESYAGAKSFHRFYDKVHEITGFKHIIPTHQGRAAERILFELVAGPGKYIPSNTHFDTTRANIEYHAAVAVDLVIDEGKDPQLIHPFKGNIDLVRLENFIKAKGAKNIPLGMLTVTNNTGGGQPVSMENIRKTKELLSRYGIPLFLDACRFAENAYFIKKREPGYANKSCKEIAQEMFSYADGCTMSAKKDALVNIGGFLAMNDDDLAMRARNVLIVTEGFPTYGGLAGRDLEAIAQGLDEVLQEDYLQYRIRTAEYMGEHLDSIGVPYVKPPGGHAIYLDARAFAPHIPVEQFPGQAVACQLYLEGGIRSCEIGGIMFGRTDPETGEYIPPAMELVRLAFPRRVYTQSHFDYVLEVIELVYQQRHKLRGFRFTYQAPYLRHFTARFEMVE